MKFRWKRGPVFKTKRGVNYAIRWMPKGHRRFWNGSFMPSQKYGNQNGDPNKKHPLGRLISIGLYFFAIYRGH